MIYLFLDDVLHFNYADMLAHFMFNIYTRTCANTNHFRSVILRVIVLFFVSRRYM